MAVIRLAIAGYPYATLPVNYLGLNQNGRFCRPHALAAVAQYKNKEQTLVRFMSCWEAEIYKQRQVPNLYEYANYGGKSIVYENVFFF